jgi:DNA-binding CsgD family transcriptional regulator
MISDTIQSAISMIERCPDATSLIAAFRGELSHYGAIGFIAADFSIDDRSELLLYTSLPEIIAPLDSESPWWSDDPVVARLSTGERLPFDVQEAWANPLASAAPRWEGLTELRLHHGWVFPISRPGFVGGVHVVADPDNPRILPANKVVVQLLSAYFHTYLIEMNPDPGTPGIVRNTLFNRPYDGRRTKLSPREIGCLRWCAFGKTAEDIATIEGISVHTVRQHLRNGTLKLDSRTQAQAVARALKYGLFRI